MPQASIVAGFQGAAIEEFYFACNLKLTKQHPISIKATQLFTELTDEMKKVPKRWNILEPRLRLTTIDISGYGVWEGDPKLAGKWGLNPTFPLSDISTKLLLVKSRKELVQLGKQLGIGRVKPLSLMRFVA